MTYGIFSEQKLANGKLRANDRELVPMCHKSIFDKDLWITGRPPARKKIPGGLCTPSICMGFVQYVRPLWARG